MPETKDKPKGKAGRPRKEIDFKAFEQLCYLQCTKAEILSFFAIDNNTLDRRLTEHYSADFSSVYKRFSENGKISLRRLLLRHAEKSGAVAIFLAKNYLGMQDSPTNAETQIDGLKIVEE